MELDELKSSWNNIEAPEKSTLEIQSMLKENNHPVLKGIRKQLLIEFIGWSAFLLVYYTMFDGDRKPFYINMLLVSILLLSLIHNLRAYRLTKYLTQGASVKESLEHYIADVKAYAIVAIVSRVFLCAALLLYFTYNIQFNNIKYMLLALVIIVFFVQLRLFSMIWFARLKELRRTLAMLT